MNKYNLSDFGLNKQSLKRKLTEIVDNHLKEKLENLLNMRTTNYEINEIEFIVNSFYSPNVIRKTSDKPLGVFYNDFNKEKFSKLKSLVEIKKTGSITHSLNSDVKKLIKMSGSELVSEDKYKTEIEKIAEKYGIMTTGIYKIMDEIESQWLNNIEE